MRSAWPVILWTAWGTVLTLWTVALLTPYPVQASAQVLPEGTHYPASKLLHIGIYAGLAFLTTGLPASPRARLWLLGLLVIHGPITEFCQNYVPMRMGTLHDVVLDSVGVGLAVLVTRTWWFGSAESPVLLAIGKDAPDHAAPTDRQRAA